jgi:hypothetical protein
MSIARRVVWAVLLVGLGWRAGAATRPEPEFMLAIDAPGGQTRVECVSGCRLMGGRDLPNPAAGSMKVYSYGCGGARCQAQVAGWRLEPTRSR